ncbi:MAG TPA: glycosyltransferase family 4 protein [Ktedonobacterales bacterium]|nr:glycosyltransferase family 4 protein [Ktedonobacterales bacterium]
MSIRQPVQQSERSASVDAGTPARSQSQADAARTPSSGRSTPAYRIDFALITLTGNLTRYLLMRPIVEQDPTVSSRWYPIRTWIRGDWVQILPGKLRIYARHQLDSWRLYVRKPADAAVIHAFETYTIYALLRRLLHRKVLIIQNPDGGLKGPVPGPRGWLRQLAIEETALFVPWSDFAANRIKQAYPHLSDDRFVILHPGIDLTRWQMRPQPPTSERFRLLFVAGNLMLKGADTLLEAFETRLSDTCELTIATQTVYLPEEVKARILSNPHIRLHLDLQPGSPELMQLYREADVFILPSNSDTSSWVALESLATGLPVIICPQGGIPEIVIHEETGLHIPPKNPPAIADAVERLRANPEFCKKLGLQGRAHVEEHFDAHKNTEHLLNLIKTLIDAQRQRKM